MKKYDVVVVGAGNAGLAACLELALAGKKTLLIEQHNIPGGCATSFVRGRFEFDPSLHELCGVGSKENPGDVRKMMEHFGVELDWKQVPDCFRVVSKYSDGTDMDVTMPSGRDEFIAKMIEYVPKAKKSMETLFELFDEIKAGLAYLTETQGNPDTKVLMNKFGNLLRIGAFPCMDVFKAIKMPQKAIDIMSTYWSYLGVNMKHLSFLHYASMVSSYIENSAYIPSHTSHEISVAMTERFRELGGDIWFNCRAEEFLFDDDGKCCGVKTTLGTVDCEFVLANINPDIIYGKMMPSELVPEREKKLVKARNRNFGARMFTVHLGLNATAEEIGIKDYSIFMSGTSDSVKEDASLEKLSTNNYAIFLCYNLVSPEFSPEGTCVVSFTTMCGRADWEGVSQDNYFKLKNTVAKKLITMLKEKAGIDISPYIEEIAVSTPLTFARYLNAPEGSVYGYKTTDWDSLMPRMMMVSGDYPIKGLIPIGTSGPRGDGYSSAYYCGQSMALTALAQMNKGDEE